RCGEGTLDADHIVLKGPQGVLGKPGAERLVRLLACEHFEPHDPALPLVGCGHRGIEDAPAGAPDVGPRPVALDERDNWLVGHVEAAISDLDALAFFGRGQLLKHGHRQALLRHRADTNRVKCSANRDVVAIARPAVLTRRYRAAYARCGLLVRPAVRGAFCDHTGTQPLPTGPTQPGVYGHRPADPRPHR